MAEQPPSITLTPGATDSDADDGTSTHPTVLIGRRRAGPRRRNSRQAWWIPAATVVGVLACVDIVARRQHVGSRFPTVWETGIALVQQAQSSQFWLWIGQTLIGWAAGFAVAVLLAVPLGLLISANPFVFRSSRLVIDFLRPIPPVAILPLAVLLLGTGTEMKIYMVAFAALWPVLFQTMYGAHDVDPVARDSARAYGLGRWQQYRHVVVPSAMPYIATGLRLAATIALVVTIATELIVGSVGLGYGINQVQYADDTPAMYALIFVAGILGWLVSFGFGELEKRALFWHHSQRETKS